MSRNWASKEICTSLKKREVILKERNGFTTYYCLEQNEIEKTTIRRNLVILTLLPVIEQDFGIYKLLYKGVESYGNFHQKRKG